MHEYYNSIPIGEDNAITRKELALRWGVSDRLARRIVAKLRAEDNGDDYVIVAYSSRKGYFRTNKKEDIEHFEREIRKRARNTYAPLKKARRVLRRMELGQCSAAEGGNTNGKNQARREC